jgi:hypothetical protein
MLWLLYPGKIAAQYPVNRRLGGPQNRSIHSGEKKSVSSLLRFKPHITHSAAQSLY